ncbi:hypothetical protein [Egicoccus sp. AB-alg6-2]|uniref:hypothetical protein n=1 Tax=Egicoccus sp. AB-alg6-2 TaxID=3242692 RepID=UPI00359DF6B9
MAQSRMWMWRFLKLSLLVAIFYVLMSLVIAIGSAATGHLEKAVLTGLAAGVCALAVRVHRIGSKRA